MKRLDQVCTLITDGTHYSPKDEGTGIPFVTVKDMLRTGLDFDNCIRISEEVWQKADNGNSAPKSGDVLLSKDGTVGKVHVVKNEGKFAALSSIAILRPNPEILDSDYLGHFLKSEGAMRQASRMKTGTALRRIILKDIKRINLNVPSLHEQKRISDVLDKADSINTLIGLVNDQKDIAVYAAFTSLFGDIIRNTLNFPTIKLGEILSVNMGQSPSGESYNENGKGVPFLQGNAEFTSLSPVNKKWTTEANKMCKIGDILFSVRAPVGAINIADQEYCIGRGLAAIEPNETVNQEYLQYCLFFMAKVLQSKATGSTFKAVTGKTLKSFEIPIPPFPLQQKFTSILSKIRDIDFEVSRLHSLKLKKSTMQEMLT